MLKQKNYQTNSLRKESHDFNALASACVSPKIYKNSNQIPFDKRLFM